MAAFDGGLKGRKSVSWCLLFVGKAETATAKDALAWFSLFFGGLGFGASLFNGKGGWEDVVKIFVIQSFFLLGVHGGSCCVD